MCIRDRPWPDPTDWAEALRSSDAVTVRDPDSGDATGRVDEGVIRPLVFDGTRVYLERYWRYERRVGDLLLEQSTGHSNGLDARSIRTEAVSYTHLRAHETVLDLVCRLLLDKKTQHLYIAHTLSTSVRSSPEN